MDFTYSAYLSRTMFILYAVPHEVLVCESGWVHVWLFLNLYVLIVLYLFNCLSLRPTYKLCFLGVHNLFNLYLYLFCLYMYVILLHIFYEWLKKWNEIKLN